MKISQNHYVHASIVPHGRINLHSSWIILHRLTVDSQIALFGFPVLDRYPMINDRLSLTHSRAGMHAQCVQYLSLFFLSPFALL